MAKENKQSQVNPDEISVSGIKNFSLIDLLMIIMIVGLVALAVFPKIQDSKNEKIIINSLTKMNLIIKANEQFKKEDGDYAFDISQLNLKDELKDDFFEFTLNDTAIVATSNKLTLNPVTYYYLLNEQGFRIMPDSKKVIDESIFDKPGK
ncbi:MAG TPA: type II secretion system protein [Candidatus Cloacimonadota bacterium]|nr:type II secretion system protein [Candidatus Cloacimonadota bacterium]